MYLPVDLRCCCPPQQYYFWSVSGVVYAVQISSPQQNIGKELYARREKTAVGNRQKKADSNRVVKDM